MNYLETCLAAWIHSPFVKALGWSLIHFLWEGALIALLLAVLFLLLRRGSARLRYALACAALLAMPLALGLTLARSIPGRPAAPLLARVDLTDAGDTLTGLVSTPARGVSLKSVLPWVPPLWLAGVLIFYVRSLGGWMVANRMRRAGVSAASPDWQARLDVLRTRLRISKPVALLESCLVDGPVIMGFLRPVVLMPMGLLAGLSTDQLESILIHELAHVRRWDYLVNLLQNLVEGLLFYHPAVWWVSGQIRAERENCCDDVVVNLKGDARGYAAALATLERNRWPDQEPALAATGGNLMKRIRRLLQEPDRHRASAAPVFVVGLLVVSLGVAVASWQTTPPSPAPNSAPFQVRGPETPDAPSVAGSKGHALPGRFLFFATSDGKGEVALAGVVDQDAQEIAHQAALKDDPVVQEYIGRVAKNFIRTNSPEFAITIAGQAEPAQDPLPARPMSEKQQQKNEAKLRKELETPFRKWINEDVAYIIADEERAAFKALESDEEREHFIEQFWLRRDPTPGTFENEYREEHYRRIAYTNEHYSVGIPGWKTDRGRIYITYGPPDEIESHPSGGTYQRPAEEGGGTITAVPFEQWRYRFIAGVGTNVIIEFVDPQKTGEFHMTTDPNEKDAARLNQNPAAPNDTGKLGVTVQVWGTAAADGGKTVLISVPLTSFGNHAVNVLATIRTLTERPVMNFQHSIQGPATADTHFVSLAPGSYRLTVIAKDVPLGALSKEELTFEVK